jgi:hypothetical protein
MMQPESFTQIVSGQRMVERFTKRGLVVAITWYEFAAVLALTNQAAGMALGYSRLPAVLDESLGSTLTWFAWFGLSLAVLQLVGLFGAVTTLIRPLHTVRLFTLYATLGWLLALAVILITDGLTVGATHLLIFAMLAAAAAHHVTVHNGESDWRP